MKLKTLVVASMSVLGLSLISYPVLATQAKHKHHHTYMAKKVCHEGCKTTVAMPVRPMRSVGTCKFDNITPVYDAMTQNVGRAIHASPDWFQRVGVVGGVNFDAMWGNRNMGYLGENVRRLSLNDAYINVTALVNCWTKAFASLSFNDATPTGDFLFTTIGDIDTVRSPYQHIGGGYSNAYNNGEFSRFNVEQAYLTFGNLDCSPFFVQLGRQFEDFGRYQIHPLERTMAQVLSESNQTSANIGFLTPMGFHGSAYAFDNRLVQINNGHSTWVYGAALGYDMPQTPCNQLGFDVGVGYMSNMAGVNDVAASINNFELLAPGANPFGTYTSSVGAWNVYGDVNSGPFTIGARYTTAANKFSPLTLSAIGGTTVNVAGVPIPTATVVARGARPWATDITAGYGFNAWCKTQNVYVGYQASGDAENILLPKSRWIAGYGIDVWKNATVSAEFGRDKDYSVTRGGTGKSSNTIGARAAVRFG